MFYGGLTYNSHPLACACALATIAVYEEDRLIDRAVERGALMKELLADLEARHPSVGAVRSIGLFGIVELIRNRTTREPMAPFNGTSPEMQALGSTSGPKGSTRSSDGIRSSRTRRSASRKPSCARRLRSSIAVSTTPTAP